MIQGTCKISVLAKDLGLKNKEILEVLAENGIAGKSHSSPLSEDEFAFVVGYFTNKNQISNINDYLNGKVKIEVKNNSESENEEAFDEKEAEDLEKKLRKNEFTLDDYLKQMQKIRKMGSFKQILAMVPGVPKEIRDAEIDEKQLLKIEAIIQSMTIKERRNPKILDGSRRKRIAKGSGNKVEDINRFINQYEQMRKMMKQMLNGKNPFGNMKLPKNFR